MVGQENFGYLQPETVTEDTRVAIWIGSLEYCSKAWPILSLAWNQDLATPSRRGACLPGRCRIDTSLGLSRSVM
jgi:hypothetical protein